MSNSTTPTTIKKYANRRLYNTASSAYVTLADLAKMVKTGEDFLVHDAKTNEDITRSVLAQIIFEQEGIEGQSLLPITFLRQIIRFYGDSVQALLPSYLEFSIDRFTGEQHKMRETAAKAFGSSPFPTAVRRARGNDAQEPAGLQPGAVDVLAVHVSEQCDAAGDVRREGDAPAPSSTDLDDLRTQLSEMKRRLDDITEKT